MNWDQRLEEFWCGPETEAREAFKELEAQAMELSLEGDLIMAGEKMRTAALIVEEEMEAREKAEELQQEAELGFSYLDSLMVRNEL
ncbi:hypothetical protein [Vibrio phage BUCT006]|nr:hypothetical protein [Vibrio phage BUCT006]